MVVEQTVNMPLVDAYADLKSHLQENGCKIVSETQPTDLIVKQGSLWGLSPQNAKKQVTCTLTQNGQETKITCTSKLSRDWVNITLIGLVFSAVLVGLCFWISLDLTHFLDTSKATTWSWIASVGTYVDRSLGEYFVVFTRMLAGFLTAIILAEIAILLYARSRVDLFIKEVVKPAKKAKLEKVSA